MNRILSLLIVVSCAALIVGCGGEANHPTGSGAGGTTLQTKAGWPDLDSLEYETFGGEAYPDVGNLLSAQMATWPGSAEFMLHIPAGAWPEGLQGPIYFSMSIPTYDSYGPGNDMPLIIRFEPDGIVFQEPVQVVATFMPWYGATTADYFELLLLSPELEEMGSLTPNMYKNKLQFSFDLPHFSDWGVGKEDPPGGGLE